MPPAYGEPDWANPGDTSNVTTQQAATGGAIAGASGVGQNVNTGESLKNAKCALTVLSLVNMCLSALMAALGVLSLIKMSASFVASNISLAFLSVYMIVFAVLLFLYELIWWQPFPQLNRTFRKNFGFMYGLKGKGLYLIFIAFLCLGYKGQNITGVKGLDWATGISWLAIGVFHIFISFSWDNINLIYKPPTAGLTDSATSGAGGNENVI